MSKVQECSPFSLIKEHAEPFPEQKPDPTGEDRDTAAIVDEHNRDEDAKEKDERLKEEHIKDQQQDRIQRKEYAQKIFWLVVGWLGVLTGILAAAGWKVQLPCGAGCPFFLSDSVLIALISGASANVIGLMVIVANYLFPKNSRPRHMRK